MYKAERVFLSVIIQKLFVWIPFELMRMFSRCDFVKMFHYVQKSNTTFLLTKHNTNNGTHHCY